MPQESNNSCDMVKKPLTLDEAIAHVEEEVARNPDSPFKREHRQLAEWLRELRKRRDDAVGDVAKLREALEALLNLAYEVEDMNSDSGPRTSMPTKFVIDTAKSALAAPPRNCDKYATADEALKAQEQMFNDSNFANGECKLGCPECDNPRVGCKIAWLFAPATEKEGGDDGK